MLPQKVHESQRAALMQAVVNSVVENGLENTTSRIIGSLSGVNEIYIYRYFKNKDDLIAKTFAYADNDFLKVILENFPVINYEGLDYEMRCRILFKKCWDYIFKHPDWLIFYVRYYYSSSFQKFAYEDHMKLYEIMTDKIKPACHPSADVKTVLHHLLDTLMGQAKKQIIHPQDPAQTEEDTFWLLFSILKCDKGI